MRAQIARLIDFVLPLAQEIKLLIRADLHKGQWQHEINIARRVFTKPSHSRVFKGGQILFVIFYIAVSHMKLPLRHTMG